MSVLKSDQKESKIEVITFSIELHNRLLELMQRSFGVKNLDYFVQRRYAIGKDAVENHHKYRYLMTNFKNRIDHTASLLTSNIRAANYIYPTNISEYEKRRNYQNDAIVNCEQLIKELQRVVEVFDVDINIYNRYVKDIDREIDLIKKWRRSDNKIKSYLSKQNGSI